MRPSIHPSGERIGWVNASSEPAQVDSDTLLRACGRLAAASLLARRWAVGQRHELALALSGTLARAGWSEQEALRFVQAIARVAGDTELADRERAVADTYRAIQRGEPATGLPTLSDLLGERTMRAVTEWLGIGRDTQNEGSSFRHSPHDKRWQNGENPEPPALRVVDLAQEPPTPQQWLVRHLIPARHITNLYGDSGTCKSILALRLALSVTRGEPFLGLDVCRQGTVLYLDLELNPEEHTRRWWAVAAGAGLQRPPAGLKYVQIPTTLFESLLEIERLIAELQPALVILDSVGKAVGKPLDPDASIALYRILDLWEVPVLAVDHSPKPTAEIPSEARTEYGTVYKRHYARSAVQVDLQGTEENWVGIILRHQKSNFGRLLPEITVGLEFTSEGDSLLEVRFAHGAAALEREGLFGRRSEVLAAIREAGGAGCTAKEIAEACGLPERTVYRLVSALLRDGVIKQVEGTAHPKRFCHSATLLINGKMAEPSSSESMPDGTPPNRDDSADSADGADGDFEFELHSATLERLRTFTYHEFGDYQMIAALTPRFVLPQLEKEGKIVQHDGVYYPHPQIISIMHMRGSVNGLFAEMIGDCLFMARQLGFPPLLFDWGEIPAGADAYRHALITLPEEAITSVVGRKGLHSTLVSMLYSGDKS